MAQGGGGEDEGARWGQRGEWGSVRVSESTVNC
jgi:hypothetical protein